MDTPSAQPPMIYADILLEMRAACREQRPERYHIDRHSQLGTYAQAEHAAFLMRELHAEAFPIRNPILFAVWWLSDETNTHYHAAIKRQDWADAIRWMRLYMPSPELRVYPIDVRAAFPQAYATVLRCAFAHIVRFLRKRDWAEARLRLDVFALRRTGRHVEPLALEHADLTDTGGPHDAGRWVLQDWDRFVTPYLNREPAPRPESWHLLMDFGHRLRDATPLHPTLFHAALCATHPRAARTRLGALPQPILHAILRWARWSKRRQLSFAGSLF